MRVNSIIKIELIINTQGRSCAAIAALFIKALLVSESAVHLTCREGLCPYGCLTLCTAYYTFRKLKQSPLSQRLSANVSVVNSSFVMSASFMLVLDFG